MIEVEVRKQNGIDSTKRALLPGETASFANVSSYFKGLNGVMFDLKDAPAGTQPRIGSPLGTDSRSCAWQGCNRTESAGILGNTAT